jgi:tetratricopeptide (TPR) repeat protein
LEFMAAAVDRKHQAAIVAGAPAARASAAFASGRWEEAERLYAELFRSNPANRVFAWRLGLAELAAGHPAEALVSFDRAKALGQGGARDIGLPAARAAVRAGKTDRAVEWIKWALTSFPRIRAEIAADRELAALLEHPALRSGT